MTKNLDDNYSGELSEWLVSLKELDKFDVDRSIYVDEYIKACNDVAQKYLMRLRKYQERYAEDFEKEEKANSDAINKLGGKSPHKRVARKRPGTK